MTHTVTQVYITITVTHTAATVTTFQSRRLIMKNRCLQICLPQCTSSLPSTVHPSCVCSAGQMITNTHPSIVWPIGHMNTNTFGESETVSLSLFPSRGHTDGQARSAGAMLLFFGPCAVYSRSPRRSPIGALAWEEAVALRRDSNLKSGSQFASGTFLNTHAHTPNSDT